MKMQNKEQPTDQTDTGQGSFSGYWGHEKKTCWVGKNDHNPAIYELPAAAMVFSTVYQRALQ